MSPPRKWSALKIAQHQVGVGDGRILSAASITDGPGTEPALCGPTLSRPRSLIEAMLPPPAPISIISTEGMRIGNPLPDLKR